MDDVYSIVNNKKITILVALDLSAAFDTLDIETIMKRLRCTFGISGQALDWIGSYLNDRSQYVKVDSESSELFQNKYGVPQGSCLGPMIFALYVAPILNVISSQNVQCHQYADDTQLYVGISAPNGPLPSTVLDECTTEVQNWFLQNGLCLNPLKSEVLIIGTGYQLRKIDPTSPILVAGCPIIPSSEIKSLGVTIDQQLNFKSHVDKVCKAAYFHIRALSHVKHSLPPDTLRTIAVSIVGSRLDYCNALLVGTSSTNIAKLQRVQNTLARVVTGTSRYSHITPVLKSLHWLPIKQRIEHKLASMTFRVRQHHEPAYLDSLLKDYIPPRLLRSSDLDLLTSLPTKNVLALVSKSAFSHIVPTLWNNIPLVIRRLNSADEFKKKLKTHLFRSYYCN
jgi:hypothetical protein